jgi:hypothetical protein
MGDPAEIVWESWLCPRCRFLYEQDEFDFVCRPPRCRECDSVCVQSRWWNKVPRRFQARVVKSGDDAA